jgi:hypothetical protein
MKGIKISTKAGSYLVSGCQGVLWIDITVHNGEKTFTVFGSDYGKFEKFNFKDDIEAGDVIAFKIVDIEQLSHAFEIHPMMNNEELLKEYQLLKQELEEIGLV